jgi:hypothetical protein
VANISKAILILGLALLTTQVLATENKTQTERQGKGEIGDRVGFGQGWLTSQKLF